MLRMRAVRIHEYGPPRALQLAEVEIPEPGPGEVRVKLDLAGASFDDTYMRRGFYKAPHSYGTVLPYIPGIDGHGIIDRCGAEVSDLKEGDRVTYCLGFHSDAEYAVVPAEKVVKLPDTRRVVHALDLE